MWTDDEVRWVSQRDEDSDQDSEQDAHVPITDLEVWQDYTSDFTVAGYHHILEFFQKLGAPVLDSCTYADFAEFCFKNSSGFIPRVDR